MITNKQAYEFAKIYIGSQMALIDSSNIGDAQYIEDCQKLVSEINRQGYKILGNRELMVSPTEILKHLKL